MNGPAFRYKTSPKSTECFTRMQALQRTTLSAVKESWEAKTKRTTDVRKCDIWQYLARIQVVLELVGLIMCLLSSMSLEHICSMGLSKHSPIWRRPSSCKPKLCTPDGIASNRVLVDKHIFLSAKKPTLGGLSTKLYLNSMQIGSRVKG